MGVSKKGDNNRRALKKKVLEVCKLTIAAPVNRGVNNFKNSMLMKIIIETTNRMLVYIIGIRGLMENNK